MGDTDRLLNLYAIPPTPWTSEGEYIRDADGGLIATIERSASSFPTSFATARLMAASPSLAQDVIDLRGLLCESLAIIEPFEQAARDSDHRGGLDDFSRPDGFSICSAADAEITVGQCRAARILANKIRDALAPRSAEP